MWIEKFWSRVDRRGSDECWPWLAGQDGSGYGAVRVEGRPMRAHRAAFLATHGRAPRSECLRHTCDNPICCNPGHLLEGSRAANNRDRAERGRSAIGERHGRVTLTEREAREVKARLARRETQSAIARAMGVKRESVKSIHLGRAWRHV